MITYAYVRAIGIDGDNLSIDCYLILSTGLQATFTAIIDPTSFSTPAEFNALVLDNIQAQAEIYFPTTITGTRFIFGGMTLEAPETQWSTTDLDVGSIAHYSGSFDILSDNAWIPGKPVVIQQAPGPYAGKGDRADEAEMDLITATASVINASTTRAYWTCSPKGGPIKGNIKFQYAVSA